MGRSEARQNQWLGFRPLIENRELLRQITKRQISQEHKGSWFGKAWLVLRPLSLLALYVFVFGYVFDGAFSDDPAESRATYALGVFLGLSIIHFIGDIVARSPVALAANQSMVKRVQMPVEVIPVSIAASGAFHFLISLGLAMLGLLVFGHPPTVHALWLLPIVAGLCLSGLGLAYLLTAAGVFTRDLSQITPVINMGLLFASAVFYPVEKIPPLAWDFLKFNPLLIAVEGARQTVLWGNPASLGPGAAYFAASSLTLYGAGYYVFSRTKRKFADLI